MNTSFQRSLLVTTALSAALISGAALADNVITDGGNASVVIIGNYDNSGGNEGVFLYSNRNNAVASVTVQSDGTASMNAANTLSLNSGGLLSINGNGGAVNVNSNTVSVTGNSNLTLNSASINVNGATNVNTGSSTSTVTIGNGANTTYLNSGNTVVTGTTSINASNNAVTNINTGSSNSAVNIGNGANTTNLSSGITNVTGTTNVNTAANATTNINSGTSNAAVTIGNSANATSINSATTNIGTGAFTSAVNLGSTQTGTNVNTRAGNAATTVANNSITSYVQGASGVNGALSIVNANQTGAVVDTNGKITMGTTTQTTAALTVTNALGNAHGLAVQQTQTVLTGGNTSTSFTLNDNGATFANSATGAPVKVTGVADGVNSFDAVNVRQLRGVYAGVAGTAAMANIPPIDAGKTFALGAGLGGFKGQGAIAVGAAVRVGDNAQVRASMSSSLNTDTGSRNTAFAIGAGLSF